MNQSTLKCVLLWKWLHETVQVIEQVSGAADNGPVVECLLFQGITVRFPALAWQLRTGYPQAPGDLLLPSVCIHTDRHTDIHTHTHTHKLRINKKQGKSNQIIYGISWALDDRVIEKKQTVEFFLFYRGFCSFILRQSLAVFGLELAGLPSGLELMETCLSLLPQCLN